MASGPITSLHLDVETVADFNFGGSKITGGGDCSHEIKRCLLFRKKVFYQTRQHIKNQRHYFVNKDPFSQGCNFSTSHVWMWDLDYKETWASKNWCFWTVMLEMTLESPLHGKEFQPVHPKDQSWVFIRRTDVQAETPILWPHDAKSLPIWKDPDAGKAQRQEEKGMTEDEMVRWHHQLNGHEFGWTPGVSDWSWGLVYCVHGVSESDLSERLNWGAMHAVHIDINTLKYHDSVYISLTCYYFAIYIILYYFC